MIGFIIIRHINSLMTNLYWQECYSCIRKWYPNKIIIIDDNSDPNFVTNIDLVNAEIIQSEFPGRAELLPYYYFLKYAWFDDAVILHDSVFIQKPIKFKAVNKFLWHFEKHIWDNTPGETLVIQGFNNYNPLLEFYKSKDKWNGCFGVMSFISYKMLHDINTKYNFFSLLRTIKTRHQRMMIERVFAAILFYEANMKKEDCSYFGDIENYCQWNFSEAYTFDNYMMDKSKIELPIVKLWTGR